MKKKLSFIVALLLSASISWAATITVGPGGPPTYDYETIQEAIDSAAVSDVIKVYPGTYDQDEANGWDPVTGGIGTSDFNIFVNKSLTIQGVDGSGTPITDYEDVEAFVEPKRDTPLSNLSTIFVQADDVIITGLDVTAYDDPDYNFKTISVIGDNCTIKYCNIHNLDQVSCIYMYDPRYVVLTNTSYLQSYLFQENYFDAGGIYASGIRMSSGTGWSGPVANRVITGNTFYGGSYGIEFVGPGADPWDVYPVGAATVTYNTFLQLEKGHVVAWGLYSGAEGYGTIDWFGIFNTNGNVFDKATMVKTIGGQVRYYDFTSGSNVFKYIRGIYCAIQRYPLNLVALPTDIIDIKPGTYTEQIHITTNNLTLNGSGKTNTIIKSPVTITQSFVTGSNTNKPIVWIDGVSSCTMKNLTVDGDGKGNANYRFQGIAFWSAGGTLQNVDVLRIWDTPFSGAQHGVGVYSYSTSGGPYNITCKNMLIDDFQKNATVFYGNVVLDLDNITTQGQGATGVTAQNGIQVGPEATGTIKNCDVKDAQYTGGYWTASGMILYGDVDVENTTITGCQTSIYIIDASNDIDNLTVTAPTVTIDTAYGIIAYETSAAKSIGLPVNVSPYTEDGKSGGRANGMTLNLDKSKLTGNNHSESIGVYLYSENELTANISKCKISEWEYGIYVYENGGTVTTTVTKSNLGNNTYGFYVNSVKGARTVQEATDNWWGDDSGPYHPTTNPDGTGSEVSDYVNYDDWITDPVDIYISNTECGVLDVIAVPSMPLNGQVTNILFAVRWENAKYPDSFFDIFSDYNVTLQYYEVNGTDKYAVFGTDLTLIDWDALVGDTILTLTLKKNRPEGTVSDFVIADDAWTAANNADYYFEFWGSDLTGVITGFADDVYLGPCDLQLHARVLLQGPYNTTTDLMNVNLTTNGPIPYGQPYSGAPWNYGGTETLGSIPADMVDWVLVELRSTPSGTPIRQAGLLFKDGTIRSHIDSFFDIYFTGDFMPNSDYYVAIFQRNHMPVMSAAVINIPNAGDVYDFSDMTGHPSYGGATAQVLLETGVHGMIAGDINNDGDLIYSGASNDRALILTRIIAQTGHTYINGVCQGYYGEDLTMDSWVKYSGPGNDQRLIILNLIELTGTYSLTATYASLVPGWGLKGYHTSPGTGPMDIALSESANGLSVILMTHEYIQEAWMDNIQFTLSWDATNNLMDQVVKNFKSDYSLQPQGDIIVQDGRKYQVFAMVDWFALPQPMTTSDRLTILSFDKGAYSGNDMKVTIAKDAFTRQNNGDYYASLLGIDQTGQILDVVTGIGDPGMTSAAFSIYPNPVTRQVATLMLMPVKNEKLSLTIMDISARVVYEEAVNVLSGQTFTKQLDFSGLAKGIYIVKLQGVETLKVCKIEIQ